MVMQICIMFFFSCMTKKITAAASRGSHGFLECVAMDAKSCYGCCTIAVCVWNFHCDITLSPIIMVQWKTTLISRKQVLEGPIFHFHDCGRKSN